MLILPVILFGIFITVDCRNLTTLFSTKRQIEIPEQFDYFLCYEQLQTCYTNMAPYEHLFTDYSRIHEFLQEDFIDQLCSDLSEMSSCTQRMLTRPVCDQEDFRSNADRTAVYTAYVCASKTKKLLMAMQDSPCAHDASLAREMERSAGACTDVLYENRDFRQRPEEGACVMEHVVKPCLVEKAKTLCGDAVAEFGLDAWQNLITISSPEGWVCPPDHSPLPL